MKYIIPENRLESLITSEFDKDLTPVGGWWTHSKIKTYLRNFSDWMPIYYDKDFYTDFADNDSMEFMMYFKKAKIVVLQDSIYYKYNMMFNDLWQPVFIKWFNEHSGLPIKNVLARDENG
jgi:hypothetical protein